jgi:hypothetical protein
MKRKHKNRRTKSKLAFRKTKKLVRKNQTRRRRRQLGGGGSGSSRLLPGVLPGELNPYQRLPCDVSQPLTSEYIDSLLVNPCNDKPIPEEDAIRRFEKLFQETQINENSTFDMNGETKSILFYLVDSARNTDIDYIYQKLFRWLIEKGADVNYALIPPASITNIPPYVSLMYTIVGNVIWIFLDVVQSIYDNPVDGCDIYNSEGLVDVNKLYDLYNCIYTLVLLLSKGADVLVKIRNHTPLDGLTSDVIVRIQTIIDVVRSMNLPENMESMFPSPPPPPPSVEPIDTDGGLWVPPSPPPPPPPDITRTKEYVVPRLLLLLEPINSLLALAIYNQTPVNKDKDLLTKKFNEVKSAAVAAVTAINDLNCASLELTREPPPVDVDDIDVGIFEA